MCQYPWSHPFQLVRDDERYNVLPCCMMTRSAAAVAGRRIGLYPVTDVEPVMEIYNSEEFWALGRESGRRWLDGSLRRLHGGKEL